MEPELTFHNLLVGLFPTAVVGPMGTTVYHTSDPTDANALVNPYVLYRRTNTEFTRDLMGNICMELVELDVTISSQFFSNTVAETLVSIDNIASNGWLFYYSNQSASEEDYEYNFSFEAVKAF